MSVVDTGSFIAGGKAFGLSRSTAGKAVARLEESYGVRLLNRTTRSLSLTEEGQRLYDHGKSIRTAIEAADSGLASEPGVPRGTLRLTAPDALGRRLILPVVQKYLAKWPETQVEMSLSDRLDNLVERGFDLAIRIGVTRPDRGFISRVVYTDRPVLCAAPGYLRVQDIPNRIEQLSRHSLLQFASRGDRQGWHLREGDGQWCRASGKTRLRLDSAEALRSAALDGLGITQLPLALIREDLEAGRLQEVLPDVDGGTIPIIALYPHRRLLEPRVRHFLDMLVADLKN